MPDPINKQIVDEVISRLGNITTGNGYAFTATVEGKVDRDVDQFLPSPFDIYVEVQSETENEELSCPGNPPRVALDMVLKIDGYANRLDNSASESTTTEHVMKAAIFKALKNNDAATWHTFGNTPGGDPRAINATITTMAEFDEAGWDGASILLSVTYRVSELDLEVVG